MKLIIDIPDHEYKYTCERTLSDRSIWDDAIRKGTPLDDVKAEIENIEDKKDNGHKKGKEDNRCGNCVHWKSYEFCNHWKDQHCENKNSPYYLKDTQADTRCFEFVKGGEV